MTTEELVDKLSEMTDRKAILQLVKLATIENSTKIDDLSNGSGLGDMLKSDYDINNNGTVDIAELAWEASDSATITGFTVGIDVPGSAVFTDTTYTNLQIKTMYELNANTNAFTDSEKTKLDGIEQNATADLTYTEIKSLYESNNDTNVFTDAEKSKLLNLTGEQLSDNEVKIAYENNFSTLLVSTNYIMSNDNIRNIFCNLLNNNIVVTLPDSKDNLTVSIKIVDINGGFFPNELTIKSLTGLIDDETEIVLDNKYEAVILMSNGTDWFVI